MGFTSEGKKKKRKEKKPFRFCRIARKCEPVAGRITNSCDGGQLRANRIGHVLRTERSANGQTVGKPDRISELFTAECQIGAGTELAGRQGFEPR